MHKKLQLLLPILTTGLLLLPAFANAQALVNIGVDPYSDFSSFLNRLYAISIAVAALLAVLKIVIAGVKYMTTDIVTSKGDAKRDIQGAILGLLIVMAAMLILTVINPAITGGSIGGNLTQLQAPTVATTTATPTLTTPVTSNATFDSIPLSAGNGQVQAFAATCTGNRTFAQHAGQARCYNTAAGETVNHSYICCATCTCTSQQQAMATERCQGSATLGTSGLGSGGAGSQTYLVDPIEPNYAICIYTP